MRLAKLLDVSWPTAQRMFRKLRIAVGHRDRRYLLSDGLELDDAFVEGQRAGKRGHSAEGQVPILVACEDRDTRAGFLAIGNVPKLTQLHVADFDFAQRRLAPQQTVFIFTDALLPLRKRFLLGAYPSVSKTYLQEYLNKFCYCFYRRFWEPQLPRRLLNLYIDHVPILLV